MQVGADELLRAYRTMRTIREFEERLHIEFATGEIPGFVHLYAGEEACAVGVCMHLTEVDNIASTHRGHGHCIAKGCDVAAMMNEIYGRRTGLCGGKGGSMHIADLSKGMLGANGIVGGGPPLVCGAALSSKVLKTGGVAIAFLGDGASNQGTTLESYNLASIWKLPAVFVVEDNGYAESTASSYAVAGSQSKRAEGFGMPAQEVDGHDFFAVSDAARSAIARARLLTWSLRSTALPCALTVASDTPISYAISLFGKPVMTSSNTRCWASVKDAARSGKASQELESATAAFRNACGPGSALAAIAVMTLLAWSKNRLTCSLKQASQRFQPPRYRQVISRGRAASPRHSARRSAMSAHS